ncbi:parallel beta helix pectate lyase-like protein [Motilibacter rhizosphaerae]|uniref:Parallel beta helix pectate lyase-like protein n=1 Tax=Motilibacter rhizosphaerae TaxID=598652 RepID=A0A4Q7NXE0_9ACTN|nr:right-handed parallel beta-helix repeat-containing protein [Motilibacter rhizosphaerae]RZS91660.1 parallel beta helix pectate lyase-like protein [Motilibacter rhizosphaerae]
MRSASRHPRTILGLLTGSAAVALVATAGAAPARADTGSSGQVPGLTIVVSPTGSDTAAGTRRAPVRTLPEAQLRARQALAHGTAVTVVLEDGTYPLDAPLQFGPADSGTPAHPAHWEAERGAKPVISGGSPVSGWSVHDAAKGIWVADVPKGQDSRQLFVDGRTAPRAAVAISRSGATVTTSGISSADPVIAGLAAETDQKRIEIESIDSFTDRYDPVDHVDGNTLVMQQPGWQNNNFGYDTLAHPFAGGQLLVENAYSLLQPGQWYLDPTGGHLYYRATAGDSPASHSVVLPRLESLVQMAGTPQSPVHDITFDGLQFSYTTWLRPGTSIGYADQQNGTFIPVAVPQPADYLTSCQSGCKEFEGARNLWDQMPAAVQVAASTRIAFRDGTFAHLGQVGLGIGNDADANGSGVGLAASSIEVQHNLFTDLSGAGVVAGGVQPDAHHPSDPAMALKDITIEDNLVTDVAKDYKEMSGILSTYADHTVIRHNEVSNLAYDGIDIGWGWGANDPGGSQDYQNRGLYAYQQVYTTPTTFRDNVVEDNLVHGTKKVFHDGGSIYNLSASPGTVITGNYIYDNLHTVGLYLDEGSRYVTASENVVQDSGAWVFTNAYGPNHTADNLIAHNWYNSGVAQTPNAAQRNNRLVDNVAVQGTAWPAGALHVIQHAGVKASDRVFPLAGQPDVLATTPAP